MPRKALKRILARFHSPEGEHRLRRLFGELLHNNDLWHLNRYSVSWGVSVGLFVAFVPVPFQMPLAAAMAKAYASDAYRHVSAENIQIHGGVGFTWEYDCHLFFKRAKSDEAWLGDGTRQRERVATLLQV